MRRAPSAAVRAVRSECGLMQGLQDLGHHLEPAEGRHEISARIAAPDLRDQLLPHGDAGTPPALARLARPGATPRSPASRIRARTSSGTVMPGTSLCRNSVCRKECSGKSPTTNGTGERVL